jgi:hypothetical protein
MVLKKLDVSKFRILLTIVPPNRVRLGNELKKRWLFRVCRCSSTGLDGLLATKRRL